MTAISRYEWGSGPILAVLQC